MDIRTVVQFATVTRALTLLLQAIFNVVIPDHAADAFSPPRAERPLFLDPMLEYLLGGLSRWDAEHFLFIAERGYVYEHNFAFFPLFPLGLRAIVAAFLWPLGRWLTVRGQLLVAVAGVNSVLFLLSAVALYGLGRLVLQERRMALISSLLFCLTPANVFLAAGYSEGLFATLTFGGLWLLERGCVIRASLVFALATAARANGLVNSGFLLYLPLQWGFAQAYAVSKGAGELSRGTLYASIALRFLLTIALGTTVTMLPFALFQYYGYRMFCTPSLASEQVSPALLELALVKGYRVPDVKGTSPSWCSSSLPLLYSYIQDVYWDVGFLRYFQLRQTPNFLLALPVILLGWAAVWSYTSANKNLCLQLGLWGDTARRQTKVPASGFYNPKVFVYLVHFATLLSFGMFCMHVQVLTRFLATSSPVLYWFSAHLLRHEPLLQEVSAPSEGQLKQGNSCPGIFKIFVQTLSCNPIAQLLLHWQSCSALTLCVLGYFTSYWLLGLALHCNFLPWT